MTVRMRLGVSLILSIVFHLILGFSALKVFRPSSNLNVNSSNLQNSDLQEGPPSDTQEFEIIQPVGSEKKESFTVHTVTRGESLWVIAKEYKLSIEEIMDANGLSSHSVLKVGDTLKIPNK